MRQVDYDESFDCLVAFDDFEPDLAMSGKARDPIHQRPGIPAIGPNDLKPAEALAEQLQQQFCAVAVLDVRRMHDHQ